MLYRHFRENLGDSDGRSHIVYPNGLLGRQAAFVAHLIGGLHTQRVRDAIFRRHVPYPHERLAAAGFIQGKDGGFAPLLII